MNIYFLLATGIRRWGVVGDLTCLASISNLVREGRDHWWRGFVRQQGPLPGDVLVAAVASELDARVVTRNVDDFSAFGVAVESY